jgi:hypothetical protein
VQGRACLWGRLPLGVGAGHWAYRVCADLRVCAAHYPRGYILPRPRKTGWLCVLPSCTGLEVEKRALLLIKRKHPR